MSCCDGALHRGCCSLSDEHLRNDIMSELSFDPSIRAAGIGVAVTDGVVCLSGWVESYAQRLAAEQAALRVKGVRAMALHLHVRLAPGHERSDMDIALAAERALRWNSQVPDTVRVIVDDGWLTLEGSVAWAFQRDAAERAVAGLLGVTGVSNQIAIRPASAAGDVRSLVQQALARQSDLDGGRVEVTVHDSSVTLRGTVRSWSERVLAAGAAWSAPGVASVSNELVVSGQGCGR
jgi:osmotically-inducible protein OsmY